MMSRDPEAEHTLRNQIAIILGYCELLLGEIPAGSPMRTDVVEMHKAANTALELLEQEGSGA